MLVLEAFVALFLKESAVLIFSARLYLVEQDAGDRGLFPLLSVIAGDRDGKGKL